MLLEISCLVSWHWKDGYPPLLSFAADGKVGWNVRHWRYENIEWLMTWSSILVLSGVSRDVIDCMLHAKGISRCFLSIIFLAFMIECSGNCWIFWVIKACSLPNSMWFADCNAVRSWSWNLELKCRKLSGWESSTSESVSEKFPSHIVLAIMDAGQPP